MCFYSDDTCEMQTVSVPVARKPHRCCECKGVIAAGERHEAVSGKWDGDFLTFRTCRRCCYDRFRVVEHELADGCDWDEAWPPFETLVGHLKESGMGQTAVEAVPVSFSIGDLPREPKELSGAV